MELDSPSYCRGYATKVDISKNDVIRRLTIASILCLVFLLVEVVGGILSSSLAVLSDAAHLFTDLTSFLIAIIASRLAQYPPDSKNTFGFQRAEALAALFSMCCLCVISLFLGLEAIRRGISFWNIQKQYHDQQIDGDVSGDMNMDFVVDGKIMTYTACVGVLVNICLAFVLGGDHHHHPGSNGCGHDHSHDHKHSPKDQDEHQTEGKCGHKHGSDSEQHSNSHAHHDHAHHDHSLSHDDHSSSASIHDHSHKNHHEIATEEKKPLLDNQVQKMNYVGTNEHPTKKEKPARERNVNMEAAYLHVLADLMQSVSVLLSGLIIWYNPHWQLFDPIITILFCMCCFKMSLGVILSSISVLMNNVPSNINWREVYDGIMSVEGISQVQDLHIWSISHSTVSLSVHAFYDTKNLTLGYALERIQDVCRKFGIDHTTVQLQPNAKKMEA